MFTKADVKITLHHGFCYTHNNVLRRKFIPCCIELAHDQECTRDYQGKRGNPHIGPELR